MINSNLICSFLILLLILILFATLNKIYINKKIIRENYAEFTDSDKMLLKNLKDDYDKLNDKISKDLQTIKTTHSGELEKQMKYIEDTLHSNVKDHQELKEMQTKITTQSNKFDEGLTEMGEFHDNYQKRLEKILERKYDLLDDNYEVRKKGQLKRLQNIESSLKQIESLKKESDAIQDGDIRSTSCIYNGERLNVEPIEIYGQKIGKSVIFLDSGDKSGCLSYRGTGNSNYDIERCEMSNKNQQFIIKKINNEDEYRMLLDIDNDVEPKKKYPDSSDNINYPFHVIVPSKNEGSCATLDDNGISIEPCKVGSKPYQRFKTYDTQSLTNCNEIKTQ